MEHRKLNRLVSLLDEDQARRVVGLLAERERHGGSALLAMRIWPVTVVRVGAGAPRCRIRSANATSRCLGRILGANVGAWCPELPPRA
jgi:hypothetical protein